ncbi:MAG: FAD-dependent monooxygenase [Terracidiphilus sp.]
MMLALSPHSPIDALIIGGGPAGAALGIMLARAGRAVEIIEQSAGMHHKVCGEFLSGEAVAYISQLGIDLRALGAVPISGIRLAAHKFIAQCELPFPAMSITRRTLDEALLSSASQAGAIVIRGRRVESLQQSGSNWSAQLSGGEIRHAQTAFLATGKHDLGGYRRPPGKQNDLIAFKMYFRLAPTQQQALRGWIELILFPGGYAGMQLTENGDANLCLVVNRKTLYSCRYEWPVLLERITHSSDYLAHRLEGAQALLPKPLALSSIPYGLLPTDSESGLWRLGDQAAVIPSFAGDGMSIAFHSAQVAAEIYARGGTSAELTGRLHQELSRSVRFATMLSRLMIGAPWLAFVVRVCPSLLSAFASHTRVPRSAMPSGGLLTSIHQR